MRPHLYKRPCPSVGPSVGNYFVNTMKNGLLWIQNDLDTAERGKKRDDDKVVTKMKKSLTIRVRCKNK